MRDRLTNTTRSASYGGDIHYQPSISADGRYIAFTREGTWQPSNDSNGFWDVIVFDQTTATQEVLSKAADGTQSNGNSIGSSVSADGRYVAFESDATNLAAGDSNGVMDIYIRDRVTGVNETDEPVDKQYKTFMIEGGW